MKSTDLERCQRHVNIYKDGSDFEKVKIHTVISHHQMLRTLQENSSCELPFSSDII